MGFKFFPIDNFGGSFPLTPVFPVSDSPIFTIPYFFPDHVGPTIRYLTCLTLIMSKFDKIKAQKDVILTRFFYLAPSFISFLGSRPPPHHIL